MLNRIQVLAAAAAITAAGLSAPAYASLFNVSYTISTGGMVEFTVDGTLQGDGDTVVVNSLPTTPTFDGVAPALGAVSGFLSVTDADNGLAPGDPGVVPAALSLSGWTLDFVFFNDHDLDGFGFETGWYESGDSYGDVDEPFNQSKWSMAPAVPLPAALPLMVGGLALLGFVARRRA